MQGNDRFERFLRRNPHPHRFIFERPHWTRRELFRIAGAGVTGAFLAGRARAADVRTLPVTMHGRAKNVIFILLVGAPSHTDTFDLKVVPGVTPARFNPTTVNGLLWPAGLLPKLGERLGDIAIVRSVRSWALVHSLAQTWTQIGRNPTAALGDIAPNIGSVVALEKERDRTPSQVFPTFLALNSPGAVGPGYFPATYAAFKTEPAATGLRNTTNPDGQARLEERLSLLQALDGPLREGSPFGRPVEDMDAFYRAARGLTYNPVVDAAFRYSPADSQRYGGTPFGNACLTAKQVLAANQGTRFVQISFRTWDHHANIYAEQGPGLITMGTQLDNGVAALLGELKSSGLLDETLVVMCGEFGRTVGPLSAAQGRDHFLQQFCMFAGAGVRGGRALGSTNETGARTVEFGWSRDREVRPEDIEATIYSALGINWTTIRYDDPFGRGFEYVPYAHEDLYGPINELWAV